MLHYYIFCFTAGHKTNGSFSFVSLAFVSALFYFFVVFFVETLLADHEYRD